MDKESDCNRCRKDKLPCGPQVSPSGKRKLRVLVPPALLKRGAEKIAEAYQAGFTESEILGGIPSKCPDENFNQESPERQYISKDLAPDYGRSFVVSTASTSTIDVEDNGEFMSQYMEGMFDTDTDFNPLFDLNWLGNESPPDPFSNYL